MTTREFVLRLGSAVLALVVLGGPGREDLSAQLPTARAADSPYAIALNHVLDEHLADRRVGIILDRFPRIDLAQEIAAERGHVAAPRHELMECRGESPAERECWIPSDVELLVGLQIEERATREMTLTFFISQEVGEAPRRYLGGHQRILTLRRTDDGWELVSDEPGIRT